MAGTPTNVRVGPGWLYIAPLGTVEPTDLTTAWDADWVPVGYTQEGSTVGFDQTFEDIDVEEEYDSIDTLQTKRIITVSFNAAEMTATNLQRAFNGGTIETAGGEVTFEPPDAGDVTRVALGWESDDSLERWIFRRCVQTGSPEINRQKAPNYSTINLTYRVTVPDDASAPFVAILAEDFGSGSS
jgi:hypothetical protein